MKINHKTVNSTLYIAVSGELDESAADYVREYLDSLFEKTQMNRVVIDMSEMAFMDSTGIGILIGRFKNLKARSIPISIANPSKIADKILTLSGIYKLMPKVIY